MNTIEIEKWKAEGRREAFQDVLEAVGSMGYVASENEHRTRAEAFRQVEYYVREQLRKIQGMM